MLIIARTADRQNVKLHPKENLQLQAQPEDWNRDANERNHARDIVPDRVMEERRSDSQRNADEDRDEHGRKSQRRRWAQGLTNQIHHRPFADEAAAKIATNGVSSEDHKLVEHGLI